MNGTLRAFAEDICQDCGFPKGKQEISSADHDIQCDGGSRWNSVVDCEGRHMAFQCRSCAANWK